MHAFWKAAPATNSLSSETCKILLINFLERMCKKMKAFYYLQNFGADFCLGTYSNQYLFSELDETQLWCNPDRYATLLGLSHAVLLKAVSAVLLVSMVVLQL